MVVCWFISYDYSSENSPGELDGLEKRWCFFRNKNKLMNNKEQILYVFLEKKQKRRTITVVGKYQRIKTPFCRICFYSHVQSY